MRIVLYLVSPDEYFRTVTVLLKNNLKGNMEVIFVTTNKPYSQVAKAFEKEGIDLSKIYFIDCISRHLSQNIEETKNCFFVESPTDLTNLGIAINETAKQLTSEKMLFLDSLSTLLLHNDQKAVGRFSSFLINKMRDYGINLALLTLESDVDKDVIKQVSSFVDEVNKPKLFSEEFKEFIGRKDSPVEKK